MSQLQTLATSDDSALTLDNLIARVRLSDRDRELYTMLTCLEAENRLNDRGRYELAELRKLIGSITNEVGRLTLREAAKRYPQQTPVTLATMIARTQQLIGVNNPMTREAIAICVRDLLSLPRFASLTFDDIRLAFKMARCGDFGKEYERIAQRTVFQWLDKYIEHLRSRAQQVHDKQHTDTARPEITDQQLANAYANFTRRQVGKQQPPDNYQPDLKKRGEQQRAALAEQLNAEMPQISHETGRAGQLPEKDN